DLDVVGKLVARFEVNQLRVVIAECVVGLEADLAGLADALARQRLLDHREDAVVAAVEVLNGIARLLDGVAVAVRQFIGQRHHRIFRYLHLPIPFSNPSTSCACPRGFTPYSACFSAPLRSMMNVERTTQVFFLPSTSLSCSTP